MSKNFYTSDLHFNHEKIYSNGTRPPFKTAAEAQEAIINNFNSVVKPNDNLYILGDLTLSASYDDLVAFLRRLNGNKIVIQGNHDRQRTLEKLKEDKVIANWHPWKGCKDQGVSIFMTHFVPLEAHTGPELKLYLHGHVHGNLRSILKCPLRIDVGVDFWNFYPFSMDKVCPEYLNAIRLGELPCPYACSDVMCQICKQAIEFSMIRKLSAE